MLGDKLPLADKLNTAPKTRLNAILPVLNEEDRSTLLDWLSKPSEEVSAEAIAAALKAEGHTISASSIKRYRQQRELTGL